LINPSHTVPTLIITPSSGGPSVKITQSIPALEYLEEAYPSQRPLLPKDLAARATVRTLVAILAADVQPITNLAILNRVEAMGGDKALWAREIMAGGLQAYEAVTKDSAGEFSVGDDISMADVCLVPAMWGAERFGVDFTEMPTVRRVYERLAAMEEVKRAHWTRQEDTPEELRHLYSKAVEPTNLGSRGQGSQRGGSSHVSLTLETQEQSSIQRLRACRIIIGVDVSGSMVKLINAVIQGISKINAILDDQDLVCVIDFAEEQRTVFPYLKRSKVNWDDLSNTLKTDLHSSNRGVLTALWDTIGYILDTTPRDKKYSEYKPEIIVFTDGHDNCSIKYTRETIEEAVRHPGIPHVHITIIDASKNGNSELRKICDDIDHCSYVPVKASGEAIERAFVEVVAAVTKRLTISVSAPNDIIGALTTTLANMVVGSKPLLPATLDDDGIGSSGGEGSGGRGRGGKGRGGKGRGGRGRGGKGRGVK
ncbi:hypothetical protein V493_03060, partial [Pseudogymnoascus sp. VKM F-4281 (FW-2241)]